MSGACPSLAHRKPGGSIGRTNGAPMGPEHRLPGLQQHAAATVAGGDAASRIAELVATWDGTCVDLLDAAARIICDTLADGCVMALLSPDGEVLHPLGIYHRDARIRAALDAAPDMGRPAR